MTAPTLLLVHSPLVGPLTWSATADHLRRSGYSAVVPALTETGPPHYPAFARAAAGPVPDGDGPVVLVAHSGAGALLPAITGLLGSRVRAAVFVDALLPHPGRSWFDTAPPELHAQLTALAREGRLPPWNEWFPEEVFHSLLPDPAQRARFFGELPRLPIAYFTESAPQAPPGWAELPAAYLRLSEPYDDHLAEADKLGWWVHREDADHLAVLTRPALTADLVARAVHELL